MLDRDVEELLSALGYAQSSNCLRGDAMAYAQDYGHIFRRAQDVEGKVDVHKGAGLQAVYCVQRSIDEHDRGKVPELVPVTYVCRANSVEDADKLHRLAWNQNVVPLVVVLTPKDVRLYSGFTPHRRKGTGHAYIAAEQDIKRVADALRVSAPDIDSGLVWKRHAEHIQPRQRVEWRLLENLEKLETWLSAMGVKDPSLVHALIGKFVYLYYLRERNILSDERLSRGGLSWSVMRSNQLTLDEFAALIDYVEEFLNGTIFPLEMSDLRKAGQQVVRKVASVFAGVDTAGQHHLGFDDYDFSYIPIETLSVIYEQFLHSKPGKKGKSRGQDNSAYYTPVPVVNFMIDRMDELHPLKEGTRVLDPACGSGAFLVQCYRRLLERQHRAERSQKLPHSELRRILSESIHGIDIDPEACRVAELSLNLTLLDYIDPPDLTNTTFKLPKLMGQNIVQGDAFPGGVESPAVDQALVRWTKLGKFDWVIGNPPWKKLSGAAKEPGGKTSSALKWVSDDPENRPIGRNQLAEAFAWRAIEFAGEGAIAGLLIPASTLFKGDSTDFRRKLFGEHALAYVANFANLAEVLFAGRSRVPAAALIFRPGVAAGKQAFPVYSPLVANQELTRPAETGERVDTWNLVIDQGELREVTTARTAEGDGLVWKLAAWGCHIDERILRKLSRTSNLGKFLKEHDLRASQGLELREKVAGERLEYHPELVGRDALITEELRRKGRLFAFPEQAIGDNNKGYVRVRGGFKLPESVCRPPHVLVSAARNWAVFENRYLIVPPRQIGVSGSGDQEDLLKALALYLNSEVVQYEQFFNSPQLGVQMRRSSLSSLRALPIPTQLMAGEKRVLQSWAALYDKLAAIDRATDKGRSTDKLPQSRRQMLIEVDKRVGEAIGLSPIEVVRVHEFLNVVDGLRDGKVEDRAVRAPKVQEVQSYGEVLREELNEFVRHGDNGREHSVDVFVGDSFGVVRVGQGTKRASTKVHTEGTAVERVIEQSKALREELEARYSQWRYFNRNLRLFADNAMYLFKPMQRFHWLRSQAVVDATEIIGLAVEQAGANE